MGICRTTNTSVGFCLLPSELIQRILLCLALPEIIQFKLVSKTIASSIISDQDFIRQFNSQWNSTTWLFLYKKRWRSNSLIEGFSDRSNRWFQISISNLLKPFISPGEDLFFLTASGNFFLFASNTRKIVITVNLLSKTVKKIPPSPLGPRGTCLWRRSGMKLVPGSNGWDHFRFLFAELVENRPIVFEYNSETDTWQTMEADENVSTSSSRGVDDIFLSIMSDTRESIVIAVKLKSNERPIILRPRFNNTTGNQNERLTIGFNWGSVVDRLHVYGDGYMMVVNSNRVDHEEIMKVKMLNGIEIWGLGLNGREWDLISKLPNELVEKVKKPYGVIMGCLEGRKEVIRVVLMSNYEGLWDIIWVCYDIERSQWSLIPLSDCKMKGFNMAGIAFSYGLNL